MPGTVRPVADERDGLLTYLAQQRYVLQLTAHGLTEEQVRAAPTTSELSVGGLIKHVAAVETTWTDMVLLRERNQSVEDYGLNFRLGPDETLAGVLARYDDVARGDRGGRRRDRRPRAGGPRPATFPGSPTTSTRGRCGGSCCT